MTAVNLSEVKSRLSYDVKLVKAGETIILCDRNKPFAEIRPIGPATPPPKRELGLLKGWFPVPDDFNDPDPELEEEFENNPRLPRRSAHRDTRPEGSRLSGPHDLVSGMSSSFTGISPIRILDRLKAETSIPMPSNTTPEPDPMPVAWRFSPRPATLTSSEVEERLFHLDMPEKFEVWGGGLFFSEHQRLHVLAMLVEALGTEKVDQFLDEHRV